MTTYAVIGKCPECRRPQVKYYGVWQEDTSGETYTLYEGCDRNHWQPIAEHWLRDPAPEPLMYPRRMAGQIIET